MMSSLKTWVTLTGLLNLGWHSPAPFTTTFCN